MAINKKTRLKVWKKYGKRCAYCGCSLEYSQMQVDHIQSKAHHRRYKIKEVDRIENLNPSCRACNFYKGGGTLEAFRKRVNTIKARLEKQFIVRLAIKYGILEYKEIDKRFYFEKMTGKTNNQVAKRK